MGQRIQYTYPNAQTVVVLSSVKEKKCTYDDWER